MLFRVYLIHSIVHVILIKAASGLFEGWWTSRMIWSKGSEYPAYVTSHPHEIDTTINEEFSVNYTITISNDSTTDCVTLTVVSEPKNITSLPEPQLVCLSNISVPYSYLTFEVFKEGIITLKTISVPPGLVLTDDAFVSVSASLNPSIDIVADVLGWVYTIAWDISFLPQIVHNWKRKSVIGLSFDYLTFNFIGFAFYFLFNMGLYWIPEIQAEWDERHPTSVLHVRLNDVIFPLYAVICTGFQILQCFMYEKLDNQRVSTTCRVLSALMIASAIVYAILVGVVDSIWWLDFLYYLSYIKLAITCIKYTPQLYTNYKHKSTEGWSIYNVILDFTGGSLSLLQMFLLAYNYDDFHSVLTDPTKLGLGVLSILFNILFFMQHYCLYRNNAINQDPKKDELANTITITKF